MTSRLPVLLYILATMLALTACNGEEAADAGTAPPTAATGDSSATQDPTGATKDPTPSAVPALSTDPMDADTEADDDTAAGQNDEPAEVDGAGGRGGPGDGDLTGEVLDLFPYEGAELAVVGVEADDTLNVRSGPGVSFDVVADLAPLAEGVLATGHNRQLGSGGVWAQISTEDVTGWANVSYLTHLGRTEDVTSQMFPTPDQRPQAETMVELGQIVGQQAASEEPPSTITVVDGPTVGDLGEITVDVIGLADDSVGGFRLHVFAEPDPGGESFTVRTVEQTLLCIRGLSEDGICL